MNQPIPHYAIVIEWSEEDQTFVVILPEWIDQHYVMPVASGKTYAEALKRGLRSPKLMARPCPRRVSLPRPEVEDR